MSDVTVGQLIAQGTRQLQAAGVDSAHFDASNLLAAVLDVELRHIPVLRNDPLPPDDQQLFAKHLQQRIQRQPLQYIDRIAAFDGKPVIADIGTGTGIVAICLAQALSQTTVYATDSSQQALGLARENVELHSLSDRVILLPPGSGLQPLHAAQLHESVEVLVSNPPYVESGQINQLQPEIRDFEPRTALDGGADGLECYRQLLPECRQLPQLGLIMLEVGHGQAEAVANIGRDSFPSTQVQTILDLAGIQRVVVFHL
jgi:release factor glutamine methyltransferase